jgi:hypothetical protein
MSDMAFVIVGSVLILAVATAIHFIGGSHG